MIVNALERLEGDISDLHKKIDAFRSEDIANLKVEVAMLKVKAGIWGAVMGLITTAIAAIVAYYK